MKKYLNTGNHLLSQNITKGDFMTQVRLELDNYTLRVLDVIKGKFGLKNRTQAIQKFALEEGHKYVEPEVREEFIKELDAIYEEHKKKGFKSMTLEELDEILGL